MKTTVFRYFTLVVSLFVASLFVSCSDDKNEPDNKGNETTEIPEIELPSIYELVKGESREITLGVKKGKVEASDVISLQLEGAGTYTPCTIGSFTDNSLTFNFPASLSEGTYTVVYRRGQNMRTCGKMQVRIVEKSFEPRPGTTIYGVVSTAEGPVEGVLVSDGKIFARTNAEGQYELESEKSLPYVFMTVPSGYEPERDGVFPAFFHKLVFQNDKEKAESFNFTLKKVDQSRYNVLFFGDMHLAARNGDIGQFTEFTKDVNEYVASHAGEKFYGITLGDMTWDLYWGQFTLENYVEKANALFDNLMIYHTIGNHDNDMYAVHSNYDAKAPYRKAVGPTYYSYNIGDVHYIALDNIDCSNYDENHKRNYVEYVVSDQLEWLKKDLSYVDKSTPVVVTLHAPVYGVSTATQFKNNMTNVTAFINCFEGYSLDIVSGHTHKNYNVTPSHNIIGGKDIREHNVAAVCGDWWWSGKLSNILMAPDGTPAGYGIWNIDGKNMKWMYKPTDKNMDVQFRTYDLNEVEFSFAGDVPKLSNTGSDAYRSFKRYVDQYKKNSDDYVLINIWNYNPSWTITVTQEDGKELVPEQRMAYDPLHIAAMSVKRFNDNIDAVPNFVTQSYPHFFRVQATNHDVDLNITVKDEFGNVWTEKMERPKPFGKSDAALKAYK